MIGLVSAVVLVAGLVQADVSSENTVGVFCFNITGSGAFNLVSVPMHKIYLFFRGQVQISGMRVAPFLVMNSK